MMSTAELLKKVRKIEIKTKGLSANIFSGEYHAVFKGRGMSFSEVRAYQYGDDVRHIDWNVTAKTGVPFVKVFEEERELTVMLLIDMSRSTTFGTTQQFKNEMMTEIAAVLSFSANQNNDKVGVIFFTDRIEKFVPPQKGRSHILRIIRELLNYTPQGSRTDLGLALQYLNNVLKKRAICFILSDFMTQGYEEALRIAAKRHEVVGIQIFDARDAQLPPVGLLRAVDAETGESLWLDTDSLETQQIYARGFRNKQGYLQASFNKSGLDLLKIQTHESYVKALLRFFQKR
jgi:uncharacterized protein (DUF58 family)